VSSGTLVKLDSRESAGTLDLARTGRDPVPGRQLLRQLFRPSPVVVDDPGGEPWCAAPAAAPTGTSRTVERELATAVRCAFAPPGARTGCVRDAMHASFAGARMTRCVHSFAVGDDDDNNDGDDNNDDNDGDDNNGDGNDDDDNNDDDNDDATRTSFDHEARHTAAML